MLKQGKQYETNNQRKRRERESERDIENNGDVVKGVAAGVCEKYTGYISSVVFDHQLMDKR